MNRLIAIPALALSLGVAGASHAAPDYGYDNSYQDTARVVSVDPIYETVRVATPTERCWRERVHHSAGSHHKSYTAPIAGAIIGGVVGNQFGKGSGKTALTVAGGLLGASIGKDVNARRHHDHDGYSTVERRCEVVDSYQEHDEVVGYDVKYRYKGRTYYTRTDRHPGKTIDVVVNVTPAY